HSSRSAKTLRFESRESTENWRQAMNLSAIRTTQMAIVIAVAVAVVAGMTIVLFIRKRRTERLRTRFGPEYARAVQESGGRRQGEAGLQEREKRVEGLAIRQLAPNDR